MARRRRRFAQRPPAEDRGAQLEALTASVESLKTNFDGHHAWLVDLQQWMTSCVNTLSSLTDAPPIVSPDLQAATAPPRRFDPAEMLGRQLLVWTVMTWIEHADVSPGALVSVVTATRDRAELLERAIDSVQAQTYSRWELIVVDDGSTDGTDALVAKAAAADDRIRSFRTEGRGAGAARNVGLAEARGHLVAYLDDDNVMHRGWLRAVAWAFHNWPDVEVLYGARLIEDANAAKTVRSGDFPNFEFFPFDRARLEHTNYVDQNVIAHRAGLADAHFDEHVPSSLDWDLFLRLTGERTPLELPALACMYGSTAPHRISDEPYRLDAQRRVRARVHIGRPLRVLAHTALFPLVSETYIGEEMAALHEQGADIAFCRAGEGVSPFEVDHEVHTGLDVGVAAHDPDVVVVYWASHAAGDLSRIEECGRPFALRVHSFDFDPAGVGALQAHPLCLGVWAFPHHADQLSGAHGLVPIFTSHDALPPPAADRDLVLSVSAGLPKKDWPTLVEALGRLGDLPRQIVMARTNSFEYVPDDVTEMCARLDPPVAVSVNLPRREVFGLLARTSVVLYTLEDGLPFGMPMSVIEGLRAGACVVVPDRPEARAVTGPGFRGYRSANDIVDHVRAVAAGGTDVDRERAANRAFALERYCSPVLGRRFLDELTSALYAWRRVRA